MPYNASMTEKLDVEIVSDVVCPWCYIGEKRMRDAVALSGLDVNIHFTPFLLDPTTPEEGADLREGLRAKYRMDPDTMFKRVEEAAHESGLPLDFSKVRRSINTIRAHTLLRHAVAKGTQVALAKALFEGYFVKGEDLGQASALTAIATQHGFTEDEATALLADDAELEETRVMAREQVERGVSGVPFFILGGRYAISGAQPVELLAKVLKQVHDEGDQEPV